MRPALLGVDVVGVGEHVLGEGAVLVLDGDLDHVAVDLPLHVHGPEVDHIPVGVQVADEGANATLEVERVAEGPPLVDEGEADALGQEGELAQPVGHRHPVMVAVREDLRVRPPADQRPPFRSVAQGLHRPLGIAALVALAVDPAVLVDLGDEALAQGVDHRGTDPVEASRDLVAAATELPAGVELGQHHLQTDLLLGGMHVDGDAPPVVQDRDGAVLVEGDHDGVAVTGHGLVDRVVDDLVDEVVEATEVGRADVHPGTPADRFQPLERFELARGIGIPILSALASAPAASGCGLLAVGEFTGYRGRGLGQLRFLRRVAGGRVKPIRERSQQPCRWWCRLGVDGGRLR